MANIKGTMTFSAATRYLGSSQFWRQVTGRQQLHVCSTPSRASVGSKRAFHFGSTDYARCFRGLPSPDMGALRESAKIYLESFDPQLWYNDPITTLLNGEKLPGTDKQKIETVDALGTVNGNQYIANAEQVAMLKEHISTYKSPYSDLREPLRNIEQIFLTEYTGFLIGNQSMDFAKQDGVTEIEESIMANTVERRLCDQVLKAEQDRKINISRKPIYVSCVSNFTNFLDLFRKTIRSMELGVPCVVLGRSNTVQHSYRWALKLQELLKEEGVDPGMLSYASCSLDDIKDITQSLKDHTGNLYATCSRELAADIMSGYPKTVASTGGPNTLVTTEWNDKVKQAVQVSASIECAGQCTALRHCVTPSGVGDEVLDGVFDGIKEIPNAPYAINNSLFDGVYPEHTGSKTPEDPKDGYIHHSKVDAYYRIGSDPPLGIEVDDYLPEYWRKVVVDFSKMEISAKNTEGIDKLAAWLNKHQPISLAVNGKRKEIFELAVQLFDRTGLVVYTIGSTDSDEQPPALTCQARPQEAECFGEFPPRSKLTKYTRFPVVVPSPTPAYDSVYSQEYLRQQLVDEFFSKTATELLGEIKDNAVRGYCVEVIRYLQDATMSNPKRGFGTSRTAIWGLQRPPLGTKTIIRCDASATFDDAAPICLLFFTTNARDQMEFSVDPANKDIIALCDKHGLSYTTNDDESFAEKSKKFTTRDIFNVVTISGGRLREFPMVGQFVSLYFPLGHIKSTMSDDDEFVMKLEQLSKKWLTTLF